MQRFPYASIITTVHMEETKHNFAIDVKELILGQNGRSIGTETFVYEPSNIEEEVFGNLYVIGWMQNKRRELEFLPNLIASVVRREFYTVDERTVEEHFESALRKANATLLDINKTNKDLVHDIHFCIANIAGNKIRFCALGDIYALISRNEEVVHMEQPMRKRGKTELFSDVVSGEIMEGDAVLLGTRPIIDLFSEKGIEKLLSLPLIEQAEIITKIYRKNAKEAILPDQAIVLIAIRNALQSRWNPFVKPSRETKRIDASPAARERAFALFGSAVKKTRVAGTTIVRHARTIPSLSVRKKNARIHAALFIGIIALGSAYAAINAKALALKAMERRIVAAHAAPDIETATALLETVQRDALALIPSLLTSTAAQTVFHAANTDLNTLHGIRTAPPSFVARIAGSSLAFTPSHIYDDDGFIYIFDITTPHTIAKIGKKDGSQRFAFAKKPAAAFSAERMEQDDNGFYFISDAAKAAIAWDPSDDTLVTIKRPKGSSARNERNFDGARYAFESNMIVRMDSNGAKTKYLIGRLPPLTDFTISRDGTTIYLLIGNLIFAIPR